MRVRVGTVGELRERGRLVGKAGSHGVCVFWSDGGAYALDDRCPHMGFPLHRGSVEEGLVTCHWHHARFDLATGGTLDPFADDARSFPVEIEGDDVFVVVEASDGRVEHHRRRLAEGLESGLSLVTAKAVLALLEEGEPVASIVRVGLDFGLANRAAGWGSGLTVLVAMANLLPHLDPSDRGLALVHGLAFVARDTRGRPPRFPLAPLGDLDAPESPPVERLTSWYRRFVETRSEESAERTLTTAIVGGAPPDAVARMMLAAATDHVFLDVGHTLDFTNKAFEALDHVGWERAAAVLPTLVDQTAAAQRAEEGGRWRHPVDLAALVARTEAELPRLLAAYSSGDFPDADFTDADVAALAHDVLVDDPEHVVGAITGAISAGAVPHQLGRAVAYAAALRIARFHVQNDFGDWDVVHHGFTHANALHQCLVRHPSPELVRGVVHAALRIYLDRFLNVPAARPPTATPSSGVRADPSDLRACWDEQGGVDRAGAITYGYLRGGGDPAALVAVLGHALLAEDAGFHWFQIFEAAVQQFHAWPAGSEEGAMILVAAARFLAAHTPTRRELPHVVRTAARLRRGEDLFEES